MAVSYSPAFWPAKYIRSLVRPYRGPIEALVTYIGPRVRRGDAVYIEFGAELPMFYTPLEVVRQLPFQEPPHWVIVRPREAWNAMLTLTCGMGSRQPSTALSHLALRRPGGCASRP